MKKQKRAESKKRLKREKKTKYKSSVTKNKNSTGLMETAMDIPDEDIDVD